MKKNITYLILLFCLFAFGCKKDSEPSIRYELKNSTYSVNCINCKDIAINGGIYKFSSIKVSSDIKGDLSKIGSDSYLKIRWNFDSETGGDYLIDYNDFVLDQGVMSFDGSWHFGTTSKLNLEITLYTGRGRKSDPLRMQISKPAGSN